MSLFDFYQEVVLKLMSYQKLFDLIIYDRIKSVLPTFLSHHVLALESATESLTESLDLVPCISL